MNCLLCGLLFASLSLPASADPITVSGIGSQTCPQWTLAHNDTRGPQIDTNGLNTSIEAALMDQWLLGFVTSINQFAPYSNNANIQGGSSVLVMQAWVSAYCADHPSDEIVAGAAHLVVQLRRWAHDEQPGMN